MSEGDGGFLTEKQEEMILALKEKTVGNISVACKQVGISRQTHYDWLDSSDSYKKAYSEVLEGLKDFVETQLMLNIKGGNVVAQIFWLKTKAKDRGYVERVEVDNEPPELPDPVQVLLPDNGRGDG